MALQLHPHSCSAMLTTTPIARCRSCHKAEYKEYEKTAHAKVSVSGKDYISGCEVCHGPGKAHADAIEAGRRRRRKD